MGTPQDLAGGSYIVTLVDDAVASYDGGVPGFEATTPPAGDQLDAGLAPVQEYSEYLEEQQTEVAESVGAEVDTSYTLTVNAFAADLTAEQATALASDKKVESLTPERAPQDRRGAVHRVPRARGPRRRRGSRSAAWMPPAPAWSSACSTPASRPENPAFAGDALGHRSPAPDPYLDGDSIVFEKADGGTFTGVCQEGEQFTADDCNTKLIGARYFVDGFGIENLGDASTGPGEFVSPRDGDGHGSHTASTAAGNFGTPVDHQRHRLRHHLRRRAGREDRRSTRCAGPDPTRRPTRMTRCTTQDILAAIDAAVADGVDVINYSIGGGAAQTTYSIVDDAFLGAAIAGIFVAASAGNDGPGASTLDNASPWITTVAASTIPSYQGTVTLGTGEQFAGASITLPMDGTPITGDLVWAEDVAAAGARGSAPLRAEHAR